MFLYPPRKASETTKKVATQEVAQYAEDHLSEEDLKIVSVPQESSLLALLVLHNQTDSSWAVEMAKKQIAEGKEKANLS